MDSINTSLDLGAGLGNDLLCVGKRFPDSKLHGIESNVHYAAALKNKGITTHHQNLEREKLPFKNESIDFIIANQIFEHVKEVFWVLHEATRVLRVNRFIFIGLPNLASLHNRFLLLFGRQPTCLRNTSAHVRGFTRSDFIKLLEKTWKGGYKLEKYAGGNFYPLPVFLARSAAAIFPNLAVSIFFLFKKTRHYDKSFIEYPMNYESNFYVGKNQGHHVT